MTLYTLQSSDECYCGNKLRREAKAYRCNHPCEGDSNEICGGHWMISVYDIWSKIMIAFTYNYCLNIFKYLYIYRNVSSLRSISSMILKTLQDLTKILLL